MQALMKFGEGSGEIGLRDIEEPVCGKNQIKIEVKACGIMWEKGFAACSNKEGFKVLLILD